MINKSRTITALVLPFLLMSSKVTLAIEHTGAGAGTGASAHTFEFIGTPAQLRAKYVAEQRTLEQLHFQVTQNYKRAIAFLNNTEEHSLASLQAAKAIVDATIVDKCDKQALLCAKLVIPLAHLKQISLLELHIGESLVKEASSMHEAFRALMAHHVEACMRRDIITGYKNHTATRVQAVVRGHQARKFSARLRAPAPATATDTTMASDAR